MKRYQLIVLSILLLLTGLFVYGYRLPAANSVLWASIIAGLISYRLPLLIGFGVMLILIILKSIDNTDHHDHHDNSGGGGNRKLQPLRVRSQYNNRL
jgi:hypothetical protein